MRKKEKIEMTREELQKKRYKYGIDRKYKVNKPSINNTYDYLKKLSKLKLKGGESKK